MGKDEPETGATSESVAKDPRKERLAAALRENLKRRKAQARGKAAGADGRDRREG